MSKLPLPERKRVIYAKPEHRLIKAAEEATAVAQGRAEAARVHNIEVKERPPLAGSGSGHKPPKHPQVDLAESPGGRNEGILVRLPPDLLARLDKALDKFREKGLKNITRPEAVRIILARGLSRDFKV